MGMEGEVEVNYCFGCGAVLELGEVERWGWGWEGRGGGEKGRIQDEAVLLFLMRCGYGDYMVAVSLILHDGTT